MCSNVLIFVAYQNHADNNTNYAYGLAGPFVVIF